MTHKYQKLKMKLLIMIMMNNFNKLTTENFAAILTQANLVTKTDFDNKLMSLNRKISSKKKKKNMYQLKINLKKSKHLIQVIFESF